MRHLIRNSGRIVSRKSILEEVWGLHEDTDTRAIDNFWCGCVSTSRRTLPTLSTC